MCQVWVALFRQSPELKAAFTVPDMRTIKQMVIAGHGWSVLPDYHCQDALKDGRLVALNPVSETPANELCLVWSKRGVRDPEVARVRDHLLQAFRQ